MVSKSNDQYMPKACIYYRVEKILEIISFVHLQKKLPAVMCRELCYFQDDLPEVTSPSICCRAGVFAWACGDWSQGCFRPGR